MLPLGTFMPRTETSTAGPLPGAQRERSLVNSWLAVAVPETSTKPTTVKIKLESTAGTGFFYVTKKNARTMTEKMVVKKYDPVVRKHVEFKENKIK